MRLSVKGMPSRGTIDIIDTESGGSDLLLNTGANGGKRVINTAAWGGFDAGVKEVKQISAYSWGNAEVDFVVVPNLYAGGSTELVSDRGSVSSLSRCKTGRSIIGKVFFYRAVVSSTAKTRNNSSIGFQPISRTRNPAEENGSIKRVGILSDYLPVLPQGYPEISSVQLEVLCPLVFSQVSCCNPTFKVELMGVVVLYPPCIEPSVAPLRVVILVGN